MEQINNFTKEYTLEKKGGSERADLIGQLMEGVNEERKGTRFRPLPARVIAIKVGHLKTSDLYHLLKICQGGEFGKIFFGSLKPR